MSKKCFISLPMTGIDIITYCKIRDKACYDIVDKGYDAVDTFETFYKFTKRYSKILKDYRKHHIGYCGEMTAEEWDAIIDEMIYHLHYMDEETVTEELEKNVPDDWSVSTVDVYSVMDVHKDAFFELFSKYFYHLWD